MLQYLQSTKNALYKWVLHTIFHQQVAPLAVPIMYLHSQCQIIITLLNINLDTVNTFRARVTLEVTLLTSFPNLGCYSGLAA